jgi:trehalose 2-sulfotransferase
MARFDAFVICTSPRSGSTLLCGLLKAAGQGRPASLFHEPRLEAWLEEYGLAKQAFASEVEALRAVFAAALAEGRGETDVFGLRMQRGSFGFFAEKLRVVHPGLQSDAARMRAAFGRVLFIHLTRGDKLGQAISLVKASQSGLWHRNADGSELERLAPPQEPVYDRAVIAREMAELVAMDRGWLDWFAAEGISPLRISYEALSADPRAELARVLQALGRDPAAAAQLRPPVAKLADAVSRDWAARFSAEG